MADTKGADAVDKAISKAGTSVIAQGLDLKVNIRSELRMFLENKLSAKLEWAN